MAVSLTFSIEGEEKLKRELKGTSDDLSDLTPAFKVARRVFLDAEKDNFQSNNRGSWQKLSDSYEAQKVRRLGFLGFLNIERNSDRLYKSLTGETGDTVNKIDKMEAAFGTSVPYAKAQHYGYSPRNLPARPLIDLSDEQIKSIYDAMKKEIFGDIKRRRTWVATESNYRDIL